MRGRDHLNQNDLHILDRGHRKFELQPDIFFLLNKYKGQNIDVEWLNDLSAIARAAFSSEPTSKQPAFNLGATSLISIYARGENWHFKCLLSRALGVMG